MTPPNNEDDEGGVPKPGSKIPYERWYQTNERMKKAEAALGDISKRIEQIEAGHKAEVEGLKKEFAKETSALQMKHEEEKVFSSYNIDEIQQAAVRAAWSALPEATRPKTAAEWANSLGTAMKAYAEDPKKNQAPDAHPTILAMFQKNTAGNSNNTTERQKPPANGFEKKADTNQSFAGMTRKQILESEQWKNR